MTSANSVPAVKLGDELSVSAIGFGAMALTPVYGEVDTPKHEVKRILIERAGTVENCPTTTQATTTRGDGGCERNNLPPRQTTMPKK
jgi:hypothetical protein